MEQFLSRINTHLEEYSEKCKEREIRLKEEAAIKKLKREAYQKAKNDFRTKFESTYLIDLKNVVNQLKIAFTKKQLDIRFESHYYYRTFKLSKEFARPFYIVIAIASKLNEPHERFNNSEYLMFDGDIETNTVKLFLSRTEPLSPRIEHYQSGVLLAQFDLDQYDLSDVLVPVEKYLSEQLIAFSK